MWVPIGKRRGDHHKAEHVDEYASCLPRCMVGLLWVIGGKKVLAPKSSRPSALKSTTNTTAPRGSAGSGDGDNGDGGDDNRNRRQFVHDGAYPKKKEEEEEKEEEVEDEVLTRLIESIDADNHKRRRTDAVVAENSPPDDPAPAPGTGTTVAENTDPTAPPFQTDINAGLPQPKKGVAKPASVPMSKAMPKRRGESSRRDDQPL